MIGCIYILIFWVVVIDQLHFVDEITTRVSRFLSNGHIRRPMDIKPLNCSTCLSFWFSFGYVIIDHRFSLLMLAYIVLLSWSAPMVSAVLSFVKNIFTKAIDYISEKLDI